MKQPIITILLLIISLSASAQEITRPVTIRTSIDRVTVVLKTEKGEIVNIGRTPFQAELNPDSTYFYQLRHSECHPDSGQLRINPEMTELEIPVRPFQVQVNWEVTPADAEYSFVPFNRKLSAIKGNVRKPAVVVARNYRLTLKSPGYRSYNRAFLFKSDSVITISKELQYCPKHLIVALSAGLGTQGSLPLGLTVAYGGIHGIYGRYLHTWLNHADGDDFGTQSLIEVLANPYSDQAAEYLSFVAGYQYYTPIGLYLQGGLGYGSQHFNWQSSADGKRHRYAPDTFSGMVLDLGLGYTFGSYYVGASIQAIAGGSKPIAPACMTINLGICH